jgi:hypothetical protein
MDTAHAISHQMHVIRAIEVAAVQNHKLTLIVEDGVQENAQLAVAFAQAVGLTHVTTTTYDNLPTDGMRIVVTAKCHKRNLQYVPTLDDYKERISAAKDRLHTLLELHLETTGKSLLNAAIRQLALTDEQVQHTLSIARSIAALSITDSSHFVYLAEALQYVPYQRSYEMGMQ